MKGFHVRLRCRWDGTLGSGGLVPGLGGGGRRSQNMTVLCRGRINMYKRTYVCKQDGVTVCSIPICTGRDQLQALGLSLFIALHNFATLRINLKEDQTDKNSMFSTVLGHRAMYIHVFTHMQTNLKLHKYICTECKQKGAHTHTQATHACILLHDMHVRTYVCTDIDTHTHTHRTYHTRTHARTHTHTHTAADLQLRWHPLYVIDWSPVTVLNVGQHTTLHHGGMAQLGVRLKGSLHIHLRYTALHMQTIHHHLQSTSIHCHVRTYVHTYVRT